MTKLSLGVSLASVFGVTVACSSSTVPSGPASGCESLAGCCATITSPSTKQQCTTAVVSGTTTSCADTLTLYEAMGLCAAPGSGSGSSTSSIVSSSSSGHSSASSGCAGLALCCEKLSASEAAACDDAVVAGVASTCTAELMAYESTGLCSVVSGSDGGTPDATVGGVDGTTGHNDGGVTTDPATCAEAEASKSYLGCEFWPTVTANVVWAGFDFTAVVANVQPVPVSVTVTGPNGFATTVTVAAETTTDVYLPWVSALKGPDITATVSTFPNSVSVKGGAYHLVSTLPVAVYQFNALEYQGVGGPPGKNWSACPLEGGTGCFSYSNDASLLFPTTSMTGNYRVTGEHSSAALGGGIVAITATQANTDVTVTLAANASVVASETGGDAGTGPAVPAASGGGTMVFTLNAGDVVELVATSTDTADLSGSLVQANKPIQVIAARQCADQPDPIAACDHLESNVFPAETLGTDYVVTVPTSPHAKLVGHKVRFYGHVNGTVLTYSPSQPAGCPSMVNAGDVVECLSTPVCAMGTDNSSTDGMQGDPVSVACVTASFEVTGTHPFAVSSFMLGGSAVDSTDPDTSQLGDPSSSPMVPTEQFRSRYSFLAPTDYAESYADVVVPTGTVLTLDGTPVSVAPTMLNTSWSILRITLPSGQNGAHILAGNRAFGVQVIGYGTYTSYQYPAGLNLSAIAAPPPSP